MRYYKRHASTNTREEITRDMAQYAIMRNYPCVGAIMRAMEKGMHISTLEAEYWAEKTSVAWDSSKQIPGQFDFDAVIAGNMGSYTSPF